MRYSKEFVGKPVYSIDEGRHLGTVRDIYVDNTLSWLAGVHLGREGLLSRKSLLIPRESIEIFGLDAVLTKESEVVTDNKQLAESESWLRLDALEGRQVDTPGGTRIGTLGDVLLDGEAQIIGFSLSRVYMEGPIAQHPVIPRQAMVDTGNEDGVLTVDLALAEKHSLRAIGKSGEAAEVGGKEEADVVEVEGEPDEKADVVEVEGEPDDTDAGVVEVEGSEPDVVAAEGTAEEAGSRKIIKVPPRLGQGDVESDS